MVPVQPRSRGALPGPVWGQGSCCCQQLPAVPESSAKFNLGSLERLRRVTGTVITGFVSWTGTGSGQTGKFSPLQTIIRNVRF